MQYSREVAEMQPQHNNDGLFTECNKWTLNEKVGKTEDLKDICQL